MKNVLKTSSSKWLIVIIVWTFFITFFIGVFSKKISDSLPVIIAFFILFFNFFESDSSFYFIF